MLGAPGAGGAVREMDGSARAECAREPSEMMDLEQRQHPRRRDRRPQPDHEWTAWLSDWRRQQRGDPSGNAETGERERTPRSGMPEGHLSQRAGDEAAVAALGHGGFVGPSLQ